MSAGLNPHVDVRRLDPYVPHASSRGGTGIRASFKHWSLRSCEFDSHREHKLSTFEMPLQEAERKAEMIRTLSDLQIPHLDYWNYTACQHHGAPDPMCSYRLCGGDFWAHQRVGISWLYARQRGLLADDTGLGKTNVAYGLLALLKQRGELTGRALVVCQTPAAKQWLREGHRWVPKMHVTAALSGMTKSQRVGKYTENWDVLIMGYHMMMKDIEMLVKLAPDVLIVDDVDPLLNHASQTHHDLNRLAEIATRRVVMNATAIQIRLQQLHAALTLTDGHEKFGSLGAFERRHVKQEPIVIWNARSGRKMRQMKTIGYKNVDELKSKVTPMILRRKAENLTDVSMPEVMPPCDVWLELHPEQRARYKTLQQGVLKLIAEEGATLKKVKALAQVTYGQQICAGLPALRLHEKQIVVKSENGQMFEVEEDVHVGWEADGPGKSVKLDWIMDKVQGEWQGEKLVVFIKNVGLVEALRQRLDNIGVGVATIQGGQNARQRDSEIDRFWDDPKCLVMIGTSAIERSLNLQCSQRLIFVDLYLNPARVHQTVGRIKRGGSKFKHVFIYTLLAEDSQEEGYHAVLETRQALADYVFDDVSELFDQLDPMKLLELIGGKKVGKS